jgi:hypothetical protein
VANAIGSSSMTRILSIISPLTIYDSEGNAKGYPELSELMESAVMIALDGMCRLGLRIVKRAEVNPGVKAIRRPAIGRYARMSLIRYGRARR